MHDGRLGSCEVPVRGGKIVPLARFEKATPPAAAFRLGPGVEVARPAKLWEAWRAGAGPAGPRARYGALASGCICSKAARPFAAAG
jgi:hypothetical protein